MINERVLISSDAKAGDLFHYNGRVWRVSANDPGTYIAFSRFTPIPDDSKPSEEEIEHLYSADGNP